ncbi:hypothetical protein [Mycobacteroides abscessus]|uniref:hypothetical protein n=1 Tax=Mycobacteroides abscessus TaxID=36809 RepID=UPI0009291BF9|nr:hypothetical protein [Mycobacteroides abscessus]SHQ50674.1 Uncharacterised protein [Mycobacteroides abscessus subsp. abscessus]SKQ83195.1 Uncharacterised protein [Mycobacteroides abscessus subsp. massiliense]SLC50015.1 Uncharacterised protein [Mycobacteroides abscessus subsp. massiliense]
MACDASYHFRWWGEGGCPCRPGHGAQVPGAVVAAHRLAGFPGAVLPLVQFPCHSAYPVVTIYPAIYQHRIDAGLWPERDRVTLKRWEAWTPASDEQQPPAPVLSLDGWITTRHPRKTFGAGGLLSNFGAADGSRMWVHTGPRRPQARTLFDCDLRSFFVVHAPASGPPELLLEGRYGPPATARRCGVLTRIKEELLFAWSLATASTPNPYQQQLAVRNAIKNQTAQKEWAKNLKPGGGLAPVIETVR